MKRTFVIKSLFIGIAVCFSVGQASQTEQSDYLIQKLEKVYTSLAPNDPSKTPVTLRLADLLADRARVASMEELNQGCVQCVAGRKDRQKALGLYNEVFSKVPVSSQGRVLLQMGHLYELTGQEPKAQNAYQSVLNLSQDANVQAEAHLALAEMNYKKSNWSLSQSHYEKVLSNSAATSKGFAAYRRAWSLYNQGRYLDAKMALEEVLKTPALLSRSGSAQNQIDVGFQDEVSTDYATFIGRTYSETDLEKIYNLSPAQSKQARVEAVAAELERTGQKSQALQAWTFAFNKQADPGARIKIQSNMATLALELGDRPKAIEHFENVFRLVGQIENKKSQDVSDAQQILRKSIVTWNKAEKKTPTKELLSAYEMYLAAFGLEKEMGLWAVQLAQSLKQYDQAWKIHQSLESLMNGQDLENHLLLGLELAEQSGSSSMLAEAQDRYLTAAPIKKQEWPVKYQKAYSVYESDKGGEKALPLFKEVAFSEAAPKDLRVKAGDLILDILASSKNDAALEQMTSELVALSKTKNFPPTNWSEIQQKSILNQVASQTKDLDKAWKKLLAFDLNSADTASKSIYYKNKIALAEKRGDVTAALIAAQDLLNASWVSLEDKEFAQVQVARFMDLRMDFKGALAATQVVPAKVLPEDRKALKLAMYAELSGESNAPYLRKFIEVSKSNDEKVAASFELLAQSNTFLADVQKYQKFLMEKPEPLAEMIMVQYLKSSDPQLLKFLNSQSALRESAIGKAYAKTEFLKKIEKSHLILEKAQLDGGSQKSIAQTIKQRAKLLEMAEKDAADAIALKDWTAQVVTLTIVGKESQRFYEELFSLPMPEGLTEEEQSQYMNLLSQQASPYKSKSELAQAKVKEFWSQDWQTGFKESLKNTQLMPLLKVEMEALAKVAGETDRVALQSLIQVAKTPVVATTAQIKTQNQEAEVLKTQLRKEPWNKAVLQRLYKIEQDAGNKAMVQYLQGRLSSLEESSGLGADKGVQ